MGVEAADKDNEVDQLDQIQIQIIEVDNSINLDCLNCFNDQECSSCPNCCLRCPTSCMKCSTNPRSRIRCVIVVLMIICILVSILIMTFVDVMVGIFASDPFPNGGSKLVGMLILTLVGTPFMALMLIVGFCMILLNNRDSINSCINPI